MLKIGSLDASPNSAHNIFWSGSYYNYNIVIVILFLEYAYDEVRLQNWIKLNEKYYHFVCTTTALHFNKLNLTIKV